MSKKRRRRHVDAEAAGEELVRQVAQLRLRAHVPIVAATVAQPPIGSGLAPLGIVACSSKWNEPFPSVLDDLIGKLTAQAAEKFPGARAIYNVRWWSGAGHFGHTWFDGSADVYGAKS